MRFFALTALSWALCGPAAFAQLSAGKVVRDMLVDNRSHPVATATVDDAPIAEVISAKADATSVTIYPDDLAMITEVRRVNLPKGRSVIKFEGVTDQIIPQTVVLREFTGLSLERNFDYDLMSKAALFENAIGETVTITRTNPVTGDIKRQAATIVSASVKEISYSELVQGVVFDIDGQYEALSCSGGPEAIGFDGLPPQLSAVPILSLEVSTEAAGEQEVVISYLTSGMGWAADYRVDLTGENSADILGWLSINNDTAKRFEDVPLSIVAGDLQRKPETRGVKPKAKRFAATCWPMGNTKTGTPSWTSAGIGLPPSQTLQRAIPEFALNAPVAESMDLAADTIVVTGSRQRKAVEEQLGDYKLYRIPAPVTVGAYQTKQLAFLNADDVPLEQRTVFRLQKEQILRQGRTEFEPDNSKAGNLGKSLPKGTMRFFDKTAKGEAFYLGENTVRNLAVDQPVEVQVGDSFQVFIQHEKTIETLDNGQAVLRFSHYLSNAMDTAGMARIFHDDRTLRSGDVNITAESHDRVADKPGELVWDVPLAPNANSEMTFDIPVDVTAYYILQKPSFIKGLPNKHKTEMKSIERRYVVKGTVMPAEQLGYASTERYGRLPITVTTEYDIKRNALRTDRAGRFSGLTVSHEFENQSNAKQWIIVDGMTGRALQCYSKLKSNIAPVFEGELKWRFEIAPGERKTLTYSVKSKCR